MTKQEESTLLDKTHALQVLMSSDKPQFFSHLLLQSRPDFNYFNDFAELEREQEKESRDLLLEDDPLLQFDNGLQAEGRSHSHLGKNFGHWFGNSFRLLRWHLASIWSDSNPLEVVPGKQVTPVEQIASVIVASYASGQNASFYTGFIELVDGFCSIGLVLFIVVMYKYNGQVLNRVIKLASTFWTNSYFKRLTGKKFKLKPYQITIA